MALPDYSMRQLLEAGVHFGHQKHRWNPQMGPYIFGTRNNIHIIDLSQTVPLLHQALKMVSDTVAGGGRVLFVGTKRQAQAAIAEQAQRCAQYFVNARWLGGMLTNWKTVSNSISRLRTLDDQLAEGAQGLTKKELLNLSREREKLERNLGGIRDMGGVPDLLFVVDTNREAIAIQEANNLGIPVVAILDSNSDPHGVDFPIPGNDDASRAIVLYCDLVARAALDGISRMQPGAVASEATEEALVEATIESDVAALEQEKVEETGEAEVVVVAEVTPDTVAVSASAQEADELSFTPPADGSEDNLKKITGLGPAMEKKLKAVGLMTYGQMAALTADQAVTLDAQIGLGGRIDRDNWVEQAAKLAEK